LCISIASLPDRKKGSEDSGESLNDALLFLQAVKDVKRHEVGQHMAFGHYAPLCVKVNFKKKVFRGSSADI